MIKKLPADDLFEKSSMTFGEHLEELRRALVKALIWLGLGTCLGLMLAERIVTYIETPLKSAIAVFYINRAKAQFEAAQQQPPSDALAAWMLENNLQPEKTYVDPVLIWKMIQQHEAKNAEAVQEATSTKSSGESNSLIQKDAKKAEDESLVTTLEQNPWKDVDVEQLNRLQPLIMWQPIPNKLNSFTSMEPFMIWLKAGLVAGVIFGAPGIFWHIWQFFAAGLYPHERRYVYWYLPLSLGLFFAGVALAFFVVFKFVLQFLISYNSSLDVEFTPRLTDYMSFAMMLPLGFGVAFQLPILMLGLHRVGVVTASTFLAQWRIAVLVIAFLSMILTPGGDPYSMIGLAAPLILLYFFGILLCRHMPKGAGIGSPALDP